MTWSPGPVRLEWCRGLREAQAVAGANRVLDGPPAGVPLKFFQGKVKLYVSEALGMLEVNENEGSELYTVVPRPSTSRRSKYLPILTG